MNLTFTIPLWLPVAYVTAGVVTVTPFYVSALLRYPAVRRWRTAWLWPIAVALWPYSVTAELMDRRRTRRAIAAMRRNEAIR